MIFKYGKKLKEVDFKNEKELQTYFENNLNEILGLKFIDTEFYIDNHSFRIDTLGYDEELKCFKIIEYKNIKNHSLIDQGFTYLRKMLENKEAFVLNFNLKTGNKYKIEDIDWTQSRIIFVSPIYSSYQLTASDILDLPFDLIKIVKYENNIIEIEKLEKKSKIKMSDCGVLIQNNQITKEVKVYTESDHFEKTTENIITLYENLKDRILQLGDIDIDVKKVYIAFKGSKNIVDIEFFKSFLQLTINLKKGQLKDSKSLISSYILDNGKIIGHHGNGDYYISIKKEDDIDMVIPFIKQSFDINKK